ncbi:hypothetical protein BCV70DRAFT_14446 [Testicularia cyperi]|uniref:Uncharacterized protein n=1 Tax=Testicularia cyperi TaxID=1882483 RepID=A0A317XZA1_9BASI|nr:hypothetical protein BCV70DRAFT_14446 [Testicularia cyperi]
MSGPATAAQGQNFVAPPNPQSQHPSPSPVVTPSDQFAANSTPRGQVNAWGWPSGFNQPSPASSQQNFVGSTKPAGPPQQQPLGPPTPNMFNPSSQQQQQQQQQQQPPPPPPPHHMNQHHPPQPSQQQPQQGPNQAKVTIYPPQPYGNPPAFTAPTHTSSPGNAGKPRTPSMSSIPMSKKRTASKSPDFEAKDKRSRPDDAIGAGGDGKSDPKSSTASSSANGRIWGEEATKLDVYVWDYLTRRGFNSAAKALMNEAGMTEPPEVPLKTPQGLLFEYWAIFWDVFAARSGRGGAEAAAYFEYQESRNMQRLMEANRKAEMLESQYQAPDTAGRFPSVVVTPGAPASDPAAMSARPAMPGAWNPAALPQAQQQQLLITAAQRQNIPLNEIKNLNAASRMALINSMNPNNPANAQSVRPGMPGQPMDHQLQARLQQQQALHRMMQQQRQASGHIGAMPTPGTPGGSGPVQVAGPMQVRPGMPGMGGPNAPPTPGGIPDGRRSVGPGQGPQPSDPSRPEHMQPGVMTPGQVGPPQGMPQPGQPGQPGQQSGQQQQAQQQQHPQHPQLNPQQQQMVMTQFQTVQAAIREEWIKAQNAPSQTTAQEFYQNVQAYQAKAQGLQNLLRAQTNYQSNAPGGPGGVPNGPSPMGQPGMPGPPGALGAQPGQPQQRPPPHLMMSGGAGGVPNMGNMTPQQRAAQMAAAGRITPAMATHDPGLMASMMGPNSNMPNGVGGPRAPTPQQQGPGGPGQEHQAQGPGQPPMAGPPGHQQQLQGPSQPNGFQAPAPPQQQQQQGGPARPPSAQGSRPDDPNLSHFSSAQMVSSPANMHRPGMQRSASSQLNNGAGGMGPPGPSSIASPSPRLQANNLQQPQQASTSSGASQAQGGSPAPNVSSTPKLGSAEKVKKANQRQRKNSKAASKTPTLTAAAVPGSSTSISNGPGSNAANSSSNGASGSGAGSSTPAAGNAATPASTSAPTPSADAQAKADVANPAPAAQPVSQPTSQPIDAAMPPPSGPAGGSSSAQDADASGASGLASSSNGIGSTAGVDGQDSGAGGIGAGGSNDDFSMFGFGGSMNDIFDFDLSTDGAGSQSLGGDTWDSNFGNLFGGSGSGAGDGN